MSTNTIEIWGTLEWAQLFEFNRDRGQFDQDTDGATKVTVIVDKEQQAKIKESGCRKKPITRYLEEGTLAYNFKRPWSIPGKEWASGAPDVRGPSGNKWDPEVDGLIGNGSKGIVFVDVYQTRDGYGSRLKAVQIVEHVPYERPEGEVEYNPGPTFRDFTKDAPTPEVKEEKPKVEKKEAKKAPEVAPY